MRIRWGMILMAACMMINKQEVSAAEPPDGFAAAWRSVEEQFNTRLITEGVVGGSLLFLHEGDIIASAHYGMADKETQRLVDDNTIYHWGSITKTLTGIAIMQLRDRGLLSLDDPVIDHLPELRSVHNPYGHMKDITIRHVMSHSAGFRGSSWPWGGGKDWHPHEPTEWTQLVSMMPYTEILFEPGSKFSYSNPAIIFLGRIIEQISGDEFEVYMDKNVLKPLNMYQTYYDTSPYHLLPQRSNSYYLQTGNLTTNGLDFDTGITTANGGLNAPVGDLARYLTFLTASGGGYEILERSSLEEMWETRVPIAEENGLSHTMGLTFFILKKGDLRVIGHTGTQMGFHSFIYVDPVHKTASIFVVNTYEIAEGMSPTRSLSAGIRDALFDKVYPLFKNN